MSDLQPLIKYIRESSATELEQATIMAMVIEQGDEHQRACDLLIEVEILTHSDLESIGLALDAGSRKRVNCIKYLEPDYEA